VLLPAYGIYYALYLRVGCMNFIFFHQPGFGGTIFLGGVPFVAPFVGNPMKSIRPSAILLVVEGRLGLRPLRLFWCFLCFRHGFHFLRGASVGRGGGGASVPMSMREGLLVPMNG